MHRMPLKTFTKLSAYWFAFFLFLMSSWLKYKFGHPNFEQFLYHLQFGSEGLIDVDPALIKSLIEQIFLALGLALLIIGYEKAIIRIREIGFKSYKQQQIQWLKTLINRSAQGIELASYWLFAHKLPVILITCASAILLTQLSFWSYLSSLQYSEFLDKEYVKPEQISAPKHKKNLVLIYVESLEQSYADKSRFGTNLLSGLDVDFPHTTNFAAYKQTPGTGWTIAGILSTQCGVPLRPISMWDHNSSTEQTHEFMANAICLGDILKKAGYTNVFLGGAGLDFAGKGKFLRTHGYDSIIGRAEWIERGEFKVDGWGLADDRLIANAKKEIDRLEQQGRPYNLTLLTLDTHGPDGSINQTCKNRGAKTYKDIVSCTADIVGSLIQYIKQRGYADNTDVVVIGDHLSMQTPISALLESDASRSIFNRFYSTNYFAKNRNTIMHYDLLPTMLYMLGFRFPYNRLGLGASAFGPISDSYTLHQDPEINAKLQAPSLKYQQLW